MPKNVKKGPLGVFEHPLSKIEKKKGGPFGDIKKICEKKYLRRDTHFRIFSVVSLRQALSWHNWAINTSVYEAVLYIN